MVRTYVERLMRDSRKMAFSGDGGQGLLALAFLVLGPRLRGGTGGGWQLGIVGTLSNNTTPAEAGVQLERSQ